MATYTGTWDHDNFVGGLGDDTLWASGGVDDLDGGTGFDRFVGYTYTGSANITYDATKAATSVGYSLADLTWVHNVESFYSLTTGAGNDTVMVNTAQKDFSWVGNGGINTLIADYSNSTGGVTTTWAPTTKFGPTLQLHTVEMGAAYASTFETNALKLLGSAYGDSLHGTDGADSLYGQGGNDTLDPGMYAADIIDGGAGDDIVNIDYSLETHDIAYNAVAASNNTGATLANGAIFRSIEHLGTLSTGSGNDSLTISATQGAFNWHAGGGSDTLVLDLSAATAGRYTTLGADGYTIGSSAASLADLGVATDIEHVQVTGTKYNDWLAGTGGSDTLLGGVGDDTLSGGGGADVLDGGTGFDRAVNLSYYADTAGITYNAVQAATTTGFTLSDGTVVRNVESFALTTGDGNDTVTVATAQKDFIWIANGGTDTLVADYSASKAGITVSLITGTPLGDDLRIQTTEMGSAHADAYMLDALQINGSIYGDNISGTAGNDTLNGAGGADTLTGGGGQDIFLFGTGSGKDTITDFHTAENDTINVHAYSGIHATITQHGADAWIDFGNGNVITVAGVSATDAAFLSHIVW